LLWQKVPKINSMRTTTNNDFFQRATSQLLTMKI